MPWKRFFLANIRLHLSGETRTVHSGCPGRTDAVPEPTVRSEIVDPEMYCEYSERKLQHACHSGGVLIGANFCTKVGRAALYFQNKVSGSGRLTATRCFRRIGIRREVRMPFGAGYLIDLEKLNVIYPESTGRVV